MADPRPPLSASELDRARTILAAARYRACALAPYFRSILYKLVPREVEDGPGFRTMAVTDRGLLLWCPRFLLGLTKGAEPEECAAVWLHEVMHLFNRHLSRRGVRDARVWNRAGDLAINTVVRDMKARLPVGDSAGLMPGDFGFPEGLTADEYYSLLEKAAQGGKGSGAGRGSSGKGDPEGDEPCPGKGWCGSCAGRAVPGEPEGAGGDAAAEGRSEAEMERAVRDAAEGIRQHAQKGRGSVPLGLLRAAEEALAPPRIPWRRKLGSAARRAAAWAAGAVDLRYDAPSRRQAGVGYGPGRPVMPRYRRPVPRVSVVIDTSGSMGEEELSAALSEVKGVLAAVGAEVTLVACDAAVQELRPVQSIKDVARGLRGGGGTLFQPVFDALEKLPAGKRPELVVFCTDGGCFDRPRQPRGMRVIWVLVGAHRCPVPADFGETVEVDDA